MPITGQTGIVGIVGHYLYLEPFYAGDHIHETQITSGTKSDLLERGVKEFKSYKEINECVFGPEEPDDDMDISTEDYITAITSGLKTDVNKDSFPF